MPLTRHQVEVLNTYAEKKMNEQAKQSEQKQNEKQPARTPQDVELTAIKRIRAILAELPPTARQRVLGYVADRAQEERWAGAEGMVAAPPVAGLARAGRSE